MVVFQAYTSSMELSLAGPWVFLAKRTESMSSCEPEAVLRFHPVLMLRRQTAMRTSLQLKDP